ncbi:NADPH-dependent FMN reductase [Geobacillus stearothermophilus]|uniref:NADPH-dependent FMN reductase n=1 Tax=Geobacillus stearothermophilus TaxID=1422 RepID=UPI002E22C131|nr:NADPH-dependent FMN reductase [Geobacillus stearothermophilus]MED4269319.1 NADPH-dependent FMN reductase [Geobacillus stearothermophilus]
MTTVAIISGSPSHASKTNRVAEWIKEQLQQYGHTVRFIRLRDLPAEDLLYANSSNGLIVQTHDWIRESRAVVVLSPVYKGSYTGILKAYLDLLPEKAFAGKLVVPIVTGGTIAHLLALEYALKPIFSILGAREILHGVFILDWTLGHDDEGRLVLSDDLSSRMEEVIRSISRLNERAIIG